MTEIDLRAQLDLDRERHLIDFQFGSIRVTAVGVREFDVRTSYGEVREAALFASKFVDCGKWVLGDVLHFAKTRKTDRHDDWSVEQIAAETGRSEQGIVNIMSVCERVAYDVRRPWLPWSIHEAVAKLPRAEQIRMLDRVERERLTRDDVRELLREPVTRALPADEEAEVFEGKSSVVESPPSLPPALAEQISSYEVGPPVERLVDVAKTIANLAVPGRGDLVCVPSDLLLRLRRALGEPTS